MENKSIWELTSNIEQRKTLHEDIKCDILIVGAGITGCLLGYLLKKENLDVVIIDKSTIASGVTKNTTAKITIQHGIIYDKLLKTLGYNKAKLFYEANQSALENFHKIINEENINCDFKIEPAYVYTKNNTYKLKKELNAYKTLGIKGEIVTETDLPFNISSALKVENQASFNPLKFINYISKDLRIYENTKMVKLENNIVICENGSKITANKIIIATHFPIIDDQGFYFLKQHQKKSYLLTLENANKVNGLYIDINSKSGYTLRDYNDYVLFGGYSHKTGKRQDNYYFDKLEKESEKLFPNSKVIAKFSAQDCISLDHMPYIGKYSKNATNIFVATGFNKWGMTSSMLSAMILTDILCNKNNKYLKLFSPSRFNFLSSIGNILNNSLTSIHGLFLKRIFITRIAAKKLENNSSTIVKYKGQYLGIYKDYNGKVFTIDARCPHLGCILSFNKEEKAYECPCHGSKFDYKGNLIYSPSIHDTKKHEH